jgi:hypothetical protein
MHASGEWISTALHLPAVKADPQGIGSALTYARRYSLAAMLSVSADEDDDGNAATHPQPSGNVPAQNKKKLDAAKEKMVDAKPKPIAAITEAMLKALWASGKEAGYSAGDLKAEIARRWGKTSSKELTIEEGHIMLDTIKAGVIGRTPPDPERRYDIERKTVATPEAEPPDDVLLPGQPGYEEQQERAAMQDLDEAAGRG